MSRDPFCVHRTLENQRSVLLLVQSYTNGAAVSCGLKGEGGGYGGWRLWARYGDVLGPALARGRVYVDFL